MKVTDGFAFAHLRLLGGRACSTHREQSKDERPEFGLGTEHGCELLW